MTFGKKFDNEMVVVVAMVRVLARRSSHAAGKMDRMMKYSSFPVENDLYEVWRIAWLSGRGCKRFVQSTSLHTQYERWRVWRMC